MKFSSFTRFLNKKHASVAVSVCALAAVAGCGSADGASADSSNDTGVTSTGPTQKAASDSNSKMKATTFDGAVPFRGINLSGAEWGEAIPGQEGTDYQFPTTDEVDYFLSKGMNTFRISFLWERLQPTANGEFDSAYFNKLDALVTYATSKGAHVILNPHNYARYYEQTVGSDQVPNSVFANLWQRLATHYAGNENVMFNLVNEPHDLPTLQWVGAANAAISAIRNAGATNTIIVPGNNWTGAHSWYDDTGGVSNAVAMLQINDPMNNSLFEVHQYLDDNSAGSASSPCVSTTIGSERLAQWIDWLRQNGKKGFVGEFAGRNDATCNAAVKDMVETMMTDSDVIQGWLWWAAGPGWGDYGFSLEPQNNQDRPQMAWLTPYLKSDS
ncbi:MAG: glycoside hydrolase family 5 protein [Polyangiaceae bacterium]|nr:glycoside hydrolase family 5 protein [Polyangiaceae bacterium]